MCVDMGRVGCSEHDQPSPEESNHMFCSLITRSSQLCLVCKFRPSLRNMNMNHDSAASSPISFLESLLIHATAYYQGHLGIFPSVIKLGVFFRGPVDVLSRFCGVKSGRFLQETRGPSPSGIQGDQSWYFKPNCGVFHTPTKWWVVAREN